MKSAQSVLLCSLLLSVFVSYGQNSVGIGVANPNKNAVLELISPGNNQGILVPKLTTAQRTATAFTGALSNKENGLLVFDSEENKFYYWEASAWKELGTGSGLLSGDGITIVNNTVSTIPQDLELTGNTLKITNNPTASDIDLSPFAGTNTDDQTLSYNGTNGQLSISRITGGPQLVTLTSAGAASGDLAGTYPGPTIAANAVTSAKIADGTIAGADILDNTVASIDIADGTVTTTDIADGTIATIDVANNLAVAKLAPGGLNQVLTTLAGGVVWSGAPAASGTAGGDLSGTYPNPDIAANAVTTAEIANLTIVNGDISATAGVAVSKLAPSVNNGEVLLTSGGLAQWGAAGSSALISAPGTRNLFAGGSMGGTAGGTDNTFYGYGAGNVATTGNYNVYIGTQAGQRSVDGALNTMIGWRAGFAITPSGFNGNTYIGAQAGENSVDGPNTFIGEKAGNGNTDGTHSVYLGNSAGIANTIGYQNTILGSLGNTLGNNLFNATAIGYATIVNASNKVRIGNTAISVIEGQVPYSSASDRRLKMNIKPIATGLDLIMKMKPVSYNMKNLTDTRTNWGFIAQDIQELVGDNNAVVTISQDEDKTLGLRYSDLVAPLVKAVQEQQDQITDLNNKLSESEKKYEALAVELEQIKKAIGLKASSK